MARERGAPLDVRRRAATKLANFCGLGLDTVFFVNSGAEANENALKLACKMTGGTRIVAVEGSFHGRTAAAGAVTWGADKKWYGFPSKPFDVRFIKPSDAGRLGPALPFGVVRLGPFELHPLVLLFVLSGSLMISKTLRIPKP